MSEKPILFTGSMIKATLARLKWQTRRIKTNIQVGDVLWIRETLKWESYASKSITSLDYVADNTDVECEIPEEWNPPRNHTQQHWESGDNIPGGGFYWYTGIVPSIFMPKKFARPERLLVTGRREELLQNIYFADIRAEGVSCPEHDFPGGFCCSECASLRSAFMDLWDSINLKRGYGWDTNPTVQVIEFKLISPGNNAG